MKTIEFLSYLNSLGIQVFANGERLRINAPKGVLTPDLRTELAERKEELIELLHQVNLAAKSTPPRILPVTRDQNLPLSFAQQRLWFLDQLEPESLAYNIVRAYRMTGPLNVAALEQSFDEIVCRHETLRTTFPVSHGQPVQIIAQSVTVPLPVVDLCDLPETEREIQAQQFIVRERSRKFELDQGPLLYTTLLRLGVEEHILVLTLHHIICDEWSLDILFRELSVFYKAISNNVSATMPELPAQYADFAVWQREWLQEGALKTQLTYWKQQLDNIPYALELPTDRQRSPAHPQRGALKSMTISKVSSAALKQLSQQEGVTMFMTLLAAFQTLLYRYTSQDDIAVGTPIANRSRLEVERLIGFFINTLVIRTQLSNNPTFRELLVRVRKVTLEAFTHQDLPFEKLVEELQPERDLSRTPLFQVMFILQSSPEHALDLPDLTVTPIIVDIQTAKFDLTLFVAEETDELRVTFEYNSDLFDESTIGRMLEHFETLVKGIGVNPDRRLSDLPLLTETERHQLLGDWNNTQSDYPKDQGIHQLFEAQVERTPDAVAMISGDQQLTYRQLNVRANQLAHYLRKRGVGPEVLVGICMERSLEMMIGLLGILKAGGAYVPLDPAYPRERLAFMLEDTQAPVLLTQQRLLEIIPEHKTEVFCLDSSWETIAWESKCNPISEVTIESLIYVIYTSGSTGKPKGVALPQQALLNLITWQLRHSVLSVGARTLQFSSLSFDVSFQEIFTTWCSGGILVQLTEAVRQDFDSLARFVIGKNIERVFLPFVALQQLAEAFVAQEQYPTSLKEVITAGEQLQMTQSIITLFSELKDCSLHNQYGPSESHVVTAFNLTGIPDHWPALPPIGHPIANTQIYIMDRYLKPVPIGVPGELYIGGEGLARGYFNCPELTAERFIPSSFSDKAGARLYKTGDLARYLPDGNLEFLGRIDHQVKIRGFRVELGEIEVVLGQHPSVREAVVAVREGTHGDRRLITYIIPKEGSTPTVTELRNFLKEKLPEYMIPPAYVMLDTLPLTPSGKVDRRMLPEPDQARPELSSTFVDPRTEVEEIVAGIWTELLGLEQVGICDNFFELGGHSLLATQVVSRIQEIFRVELPLRNLFEVPNVAGLAESIETILWVVENSPQIRHVMMDNREEGEL